MLEVNWRKRKRQVLLFFGVILLPAIAVVGLALRVYRQEAELAEKSVAEERLARLDELRRALAARLEAIKLAELNLLIRTPSTPLPDRPDDSPIVLVTPVKGDHFALPWTESQPAAAPSAERPGQDLEDGEVLEFRRKDLEGAAVLYRDAISTSRKPQERCDAQLHLGRILLKLAQSTEARDIYESMMRECRNVTDDDRIPLSLYASERMLRTGMAEGSARQFLAREANAFRLRLPAEMSLFNELLSESGPDRLEQSFDRMRSENDLAQDLVTLSNDFPKVLARMNPTEVESHDAAWVAWGSGPWLVTVTKSTPPLPSLVFVVSAVKVTSPGTRLTTTATSAGEPVGEGFPGLRIEVDERASAVHTLPAYFYAIGIGLVLGMMLLIGCLMLRDVNREVRTAQLRADFVASVSHDLKTPLTVIRMYAEMLMGGQLEDSQAVHDYHATILNESQRLGHLVDNVLDFSKLESDRNSYSFSLVSLAVVVESAAKAMEYALAKDGFTLNVHIDSHIPVVSADSVALEQALVNLLTNAMKYSGESRLIELRLKRSEREVRIEIRDWGVGIAPEHHKRIFEKFCRLKSPGTEAITGTGLGLTLAAHIVQAHGGSVDVRSSVGEGSTFTIRIPLPSMSENEEGPA